jgi:signal peptide peptidase SppA
MHAGDHGGPIERQAAAPRTAARGSGAIAVIPAIGVIMQRASMMSEICDGGTSTQAISQALRQANADETVSSIILELDGPGGSVFGIAELAAEIRASSKPVTGMINSQAASAHYWLGSACAELYCTPGGEVGSIGVWMAHEDVSKALSEAGIDVTLISAGKYKVEGNPYGPLDPEAKGYLQSRTDDYYTAFTRDVAKGRKCSVDQVRGGMGQGRVLGAAQAKAENMIDGVMTFDQVIRHVQKSIAPAARGRSAQEQQRQQLALLALQ